LFTRGGNQRDWYEDAHRENAFGCDLIGGERCMSTRSIVNLADVPLRDFGNGRAFAAKLGRVGPLIGARKLGCMLHIVPPGKKAFPRHAHHANEEMFFILSGEGTYRLGAESLPIRTNDLIAAPAGDGETAHQIVYTSGDELRYLAFSTPNDPRCCRISRFREVRGGVHDSRG
jgi:uncharacterized cupin superfamily protein